MHSSLCALFFVFYFFSFYIQSSSFPCDLFNISNPTIDHFWILLSLLAVEMSVCKLSAGIEKLNFDQIVSKLYHLLCLATLDGCVLTMNRLLIIIVFISFVYIHFFHRTPNKPWSLHCSAKFWTRRATRHRRLLLPEFQRQYLCCVRKWWELHEEECCPTWLPSLFSACDERSPLTWYPADLPTVPFVGKFLRWPAKEGTGNQV